MNSVSKAGSLGRVATLLLNGFVNIEYGHTHTHTDTSVGTPSSFSFITDLAGVLLAKLKDMRTP